MASVYIPPGGSQQLHDSPVAARFQLLSDTASDALQHGYVILGGDFNAKVANRNDISGSDMDFLEDSGISFHRGMSSPRENLHGRMLYMLINFCMRTSLLLGTGRLLGEMTASPTYFRGSSGSRLDHFSMDRCTLARATDCTIQQDPIGYDSDHKPLVLGLSFSAPTVTADVPDGPPGLLLPKLHWDGSKKDDYVSHLRDSGTALAECERLVSTGDISAAFAKLGEVLIDAAKAAGCKHVDGSRPSRGMRHDKPYLTRNVGACERSSDMQLGMILRVSGYWRGVSPPPFAESAASIGNGRLQLSCAT